MSGYVRGEVREETSTPASVGRALGSEVMRRLAAMALGLALLATACSSAEQPTTTTRSPPPRRRNAVWFYTLTLWIKRTDPNQRVPSLD